MQGQVTGEGLSGVQSGTQETMLGESGVTHAKQQLS